MSLETSPHSPTWDLTPKDEFYKGQLPECSGIPGVGIGDAKFLRVFSASESTVTPDGYNYVMGEAISKVSTIRLVFAHGPSQLVMPVAGDFVAFYGLQDHLVAIEPIIGNKVKAHCLTRIRKGGLSGLDVFC